MGGVSSDGNVEHKDRKHQMQIRSICCHPQASEVIFSCGMDKKILIWDTRAGAHAQGFVYGPDLFGDSMDVSADGNTLLTGSYRARQPIQLYDVRKANVTVNEEVKKSYTAARLKRSYEWVGNQSAQTK